MSGSPIVGLLCKAQQEPEIQNDQNAVEFAQVVPDRTRCMGARVHRNRRPYAQARLCWRCANTAPDMLKHDAVEGKGRLSHRNDVGLWSPAAGLRRGPREAFQHHVRIDLDHLLLAETAAGLEPGADAGEHGKDTESRDGRIGYGEFTPGHPAIKDVNQLALVSAAQSDDYAIVPRLKTAQLGIADEDFPLVEQCDSRDGRR